jgi:hypothetical protein
LLNYSGICIGTYFVPINMTLSIRMIGEEIIQQSIQLKIVCEFINLDGF